VIPTDSQISEVVIDESRSKPHEQNKSSAVDQSKAHHP
jgi:hypothetical protein